MKPMITETTSRGAPLGRPTACWQRQRMRGLLALLCLGIGWGASVAGGQGLLLDRLSGFDRQRVAEAGRWATQPRDQEAFREAAKLVYQLRRLPGERLPAGDEPGLRSPGDPLHWEGVALDVAAMPLPAALAATLEMPRLYRVMLRVDGRRCVLISGAVPRAWQRAAAEDAVGEAAEGVSGDETGEEAAAEPGWRCAMTGVVCAVDAEGRPVVAAAPSVEWYPTAWDRVADVGLALLGRHQVDVRALDDVAASQQQPLQSSEREIFYSMLRAAGRLEGEQTPPPTDMPVSALLRDAAQLAGHWVRVPLDSVRVTRVVVEDPDVRAWLGQGHYWQIDAMGDLGDLIVTIEVEDGNREGERQEPVTFANRYPVSVAALRLPDRLQAALEAAAGGEAAVAMVRRRLVVEGFKYRLWSYDTAFMRRQAGHQQFGPLLIASQLSVPPQPTGDPRGAAMIGWGAAIAFLVGLAALAVGLWRAGRRDAAATRRRRAQQAEEVEFPST